MPVFWILAVIFSLATLFHLRKINEMANELKRLQKKNEEARKEFTKRKEEFNNEEDL